MDATRSGHNGPERVVVFAGALNIFSIERLHCDINHFFLAKLTESLLIESRTCGNMSSHFQGN